MKFTIFQKPEAFNPNIEKTVKEKAEALGLIYDPVHYEVVIYVGGDGTFLRAAQYYLKELDKICLFGLNIGNLGYFYDYDYTNIDEALKSLADGECQLKESHLLHCEILYEDGSKTTVEAVNEVRIENPFHTLICDVNIEGNNLETYRGTGLLVSSAIGTSAYNRSLSGALIDPSLDMMELTEIASIENNAYCSLGSSVVLSSRSKIEFVGEFKQAVIGYDATVLDKQDAVKLTFTTSPKVVRILHCKNYSFVDNWKKSFIR